ncbi:unnamed protein product [Schistosoma intercalatum]|nr:unnamed protein product [Schistosoma intercalatum]CAH8435288.1 unnamed protein product [Schistosoma intercalatum]
MPVPYPQHPIPIEALSEYDIREILLDGHEILEKPLTPAANFQRIINHIDFSESSSYSDSCSQNKESEFFPKNFTPKIWENVKETLRTTLIEINALVDVLSIIKEGKYLAINPVADDSQETNLSLYLSGKKRSIAAAADILMKGAERLRRRHSELIDARVRRSNSIVPPQFDSTHNSFHKALMHLRQEWRLKLHQNSILGDVSLRSVGSHFRESGNFEIRESDGFADSKSDVESQDDKCVDAVTGVMIIFSQSMEALLNLSHGPGLLNVEFLESDINSLPTPLLEFIFHKQQISSCSRDPSPINQRQKLFKAQRLLACREILSLLSCEASTSKEYNHLTGSVAFATQDKIIATLFPGVQICLSSAVRPTVFREDVSGDERPKLQDKKSDHTVSTMDYSNCINLQLHRMLAGQHRAVWPNLASLPQPTCGPVEIPLYYRSGGANGLHASKFSSLPYSTKFSGFSVAVASVSGFASQAASALCVIHSTNRTNSNSVEKTNTFSQRSQPIFAGQDRLSLFTEWGHSLPGGACVPSVGFRHGVPNSADDSVPGTSDIAMLEYTLLSRGVDEDTMKTVLGTNPSLLSRTIAISRHHYLRDQVYSIISELSQCSPIKIIAHWDTFNSATETSVRLCFYCTDYDAYRSWLGVTITPNGLVVLYADPPRTYRLGMDLNRLRDVLNNQVLYTQMNYIDILAIKILGWVRLGNNPFSALANPEEIGDGPVIVKMFASPSAKHLICLRASAVMDIRMFVSRCSPCDYQFTTDHKDIFSNQDFREVFLSHMYGKSLVSKVEALMTLLS